MLKILYVDTLYPVGHMVFSSLTISALMSLDAELTIHQNERCTPKDASIVFIILLKYLVRQNTSQHNE